ncbi:MAG TPA: alpha/beta hydrolase [Rhizomicrobium sp.]|jgi:phosphinothricin tripeptide acetyl hydrolase|nr:alpha/beta hydrolase [Rhizomicrobium sp.]
MPSEEFRKLVRYIRGRPAQTLSIEQRRTAMDTVGRGVPLPDGLESATEARLPRAAEWLLPRTHDDSVLVHFHGGGFQLGSIDSHRHLAAYIAAAAGTRGLIFDFRLAPEHPFPAAADDCLAFYRGLLSSGVAPARIALIGDSSGAALLLDTMLAARAAGLPLPAAAVLLSPVLDFKTHASLRDAGDDDPTLDPEWLRAAMAAYRGGAALDDPRLSPLRAELRGLPPLLVQTGAGEYLTPDVHRFAARCRDAHVSITMDEWLDMIHVWQWFAPRLPEAMEAIGRIAAFLRLHIPPQSHPTIEPANASSHSRGRKKWQSPRNHRIGASGATPMKGERRISSRRKFSKKPAA